ncbi:hypothetical protein BGW80DRAFT_1252393 [Lactifluus volemus]|nr:hypothetical protein BGW80DRAFT_1252393 [Lactifluus volemus]
MVRGNAGERDVTFLTPFLLRLGKLKTVQGGNLQSFQLSSFLKSFKVGKSWSFQVGNFKNCFHVSNYSFQVDSFLKSFKVEFKSCFQLEELQGWRLQLQRWQLELNVGRLSFKVGRLSFNVGSLDSFHVGKSWTVRSDDRGRGYHESPQKALRKAGTDSRRERSNGVTNRLEDGRKNK